MEWIPLTQGLSDNSKKSNWQSAGLPFIVVTALLLVAFIVSLGVGKYALSPREIFSILSGGGDALARNVFFRLRLSRTLMALIAGLALGLSGGVFQIIFKNPLATPDIIGVTSGANLGAATVLALLSYNIAAMIPAAFVGGIVVSLLVVALVQVSDKNSAVNYIVAGIVLQAVSEAFIMLLKYFADPEKELAAIEYWSMGSFRQVTSSKFLAVLPVFVVGYAALFFLRRQITLLGLGDEESQSLGVNVGAVRLIVLGFATLLVASIISVTGKISFIGLIAPHIARLILKKSGFKSCVLASLVGAFVLLVADCFARTLHSTELPISILTTFVGVPILVFYLYNRKAGVTL